MSKQGGDDLDDDFVPDDLVALSEDEDGGQSAEGDDVGAFLSAGEDEAQSSRPQGAPANASEKKRKRRAKEKERKAKVSGDGSFAGRRTLTSPRMMHDARNAGQ